MSRLQIIILSFFLFLMHRSFAQKDSFSLVRSYEGEIADVVMDNLENLYIISSSGQIKKFNAAGDSVAVYNQVRNFGHLYSLDVSNPLKLLLFYKDFSTIVVLDRYFAPLGSIDLRQHSILQPDAIGLSYDNNIWVFDEYDNKLKKINEQGDLLQETSDFRALFGQTISPQKIINDNGLVYVADSANGVFVFDNYGTFKRRLPVKNWQSIVIKGNLVISTQNELLTVYDTNTQMQTQRKNPFFKPHLHSFVHGNKIVNYSNNSLSIYQLTPIP